MSDEEYNLGSSTEIGQQIYSNLLLGFQHFEQRLGDLRAFINKGAYNTSGLSRWQLVQLMKYDLEFMKMHLIVLNQALDAEKK